MIETINTHISDEAMAIIISEITWRSYFEKVDMEVEGHKFFMFKPFFYYYEDLIGNGDKSALDYSFFIAIPVNEKGQLVKTHNDKKIDFQNPNEHVSLLEALYALEPVLTESTGGKSLNDELLKTLLFKRVVNVNAIDTIFDIQDDFPSGVWEEMASARINTYDNANVMSPSFDYALDLFLNKSEAIIKFEIFEEMHQFDYLSNVLKTLMDTDDVSENMCDDQKRSFLVGLDREEILQAVFYEDEKDCGLIIYNWEAAMTIKDRRQIEVMLRVLKKIGYTELALRARNKEEYKAEQLARRKYRKELSSRGNLLEKEKRLTDRMREGISRERPMTGKELLESKYRNIA